LIHTTLQVTEIRQIHRIQSTSTPIQNSAEKSACIQFRGQKRLLKWMAIMPPSSSR